MHWHFPLLLLIAAPGTRGQLGQNIGNQATSNSLNQVNAGQVYTGTSTNPFYGVNLAPFGPDAGDLMVNPGMLTSGQTIDLYMFFPYYGGLYNYTTLSVNGYMAFATVLDQGPTINVGPDLTDWPRVQDPAMIAPYLCKQQIPQSGNPARRAGVYYRLVLRSSLFGQGTTGTATGVNTGTLTGSSFFNQASSSACPGTADSYTRCDTNSDYFLEQMMLWLTEGVAGASMFRADAALVVTWFNTASAISGRSDIDAGQTATYQVIWLADSTARLSYTIINYDRLGFDAQDFRGNSRSGRCRAVFNGGNHTGLVDVDPTQPYKNTPKVLAQRSGVPQMVRGRYMFRVDDIVRPAGCSNKTGGTYPMLIYPNIVNMLGEVTVEVNAVCLDYTTTYIMMIEEREIATCQVLNAAIARCTIPKVYDWGTKTVYFQPQNMGANQERAFVGYIYFVPPTLDPMRLDIGNLYEWYKSPMTTYLMPVSWYPRNFTNPDLINNAAGGGSNMGVRITDDAMYSVQLGLYIIGYREYKDDQFKKFRPEHRTLARVTTYSNNNGYQYRWQPQEEVINTMQIQQWYLTEWERLNTLYTYRVGYFKLAPINPNDMNGTQVLPGLVSAPVSLHWLWSATPQEYNSIAVSEQDREHRNNFVKTKSREMCEDWYNEDGALYNFIMDTETNNSCPCVEAQAQQDLGRFMPHPRCSQIFRDIACTTVIGSKNCYMSAQNIYASYNGNGRHFDSLNTHRFMTTYGQVCCYDDNGYLMQTPYQPVIKTQKEYFYNPGYPTRAYEFGTTPYMGQFEVPGFSAFYNDYMPYYFCCKFTDFRCQMFYWRRPSSACQQYQPPASSFGSGPGVFNTLDNDKFIFNEPGVFNYLYIPQTLRTPQVRVQIRLERYPNRKVDFGLLGRYIPQWELVQPTNVTVITGVALEATGTDRVVITCRKDTRRFRYRTNIIVGNLLRYFDTIRLQRFKGVLIYINNIQRGIPEIYAVLEEAQVGIKVTESYALDIDRLSDYQESMGMLDVRLSLPPQYGVRPDGDKSQEQQYRTLYNLPRVSGLIRPFPDQTTGSYTQGLTIDDVNSETYRQQIINNYLIPGSGEGASQLANTITSTNTNMPQDNMFTQSTDEDKAFDVFPEAFMRTENVYKTAPIFDSAPFQFVPQTGQMILQLLNTCRDLQYNPNTDRNPYETITDLRYGNMCPDDPGSVISDCGDSIPCLYDYALLNSKELAQSEQEAYQSFNLMHTQSIKQYNSCGAINIEYPEYMMKTPTLGPAYLQGDVALFNCYQTHWIKGVHEYKCGLVVDYNQPNQYRFEWNKGDQPWCRSRVLENYFRWLAIIFGIVGILTVIVLIFLVCWCIKQKRLQDQRNYGGSAAYNNQAYETKPPARTESFGEMSNAPRGATIYNPSRLTPATLEPQRATPAMTQVTEQPSQSIPGLLGLNTSV